MTPPLDDLAAQAQNQNRLELINAINRRNSEAEQAALSQIRIGDRDPETGSQIIIWPNGAEIRGAEAINTGAIPGGSVVGGTSLGGGKIVIDGPQASPLSPIEEEEEETPLVSNIKILFYQISSDNIYYDFYIGGDRATPLKVVSIPGAFFAHITNLGTDKSDWIVSIFHPRSLDLLQDGFFITTVQGFADENGESQWSVQVFPEENFTAAISWSQILQSCNYVGDGVWVTQPSIPQLFNSYENNAVIYPPTIYEDGLTRINLGSTDDGYWNRDPKYRLYYDGSDYVGEFVYLDGSISGQWENASFLDLSLSVSSYTVNKKIYKNSISDFQGNYSLQSTKAYSGTESKESNSDQNKSYSLEISEVQYQKTSEFNTNLSNGNTYEYRPITASATLNHLTLLNKRENSYFNLSYSISGSWQTLFSSSAISGPSESNGSVTKARNAEIKIGSSSTELTVLVQDEADFPVVDSSSSSSSSYFSDTYHSGVWSGATLSGSTIYQIDLSLTGSSGEFNTVFGLNLWSDSPQKQKTIKVQSITFTEEAYTKAEIEEPFYILPRNSTFSSAVVVSASYFAP